jgi:hypothetical protein
MCDKFPTYEIRSARSRSCRLRVGSHFSRSIGLKNPADRLTRQKRPDSQPGFMGELQIVNAGGTAARLS